MYKMKIILLSLFLFVGFLESAFSFSFANFNILNETSSKENNSTDEDARLFNFTILISATMNENIQNGVLAQGNFSIVETLTNITTSPVVNTAAKNNLELSTFRASWTNALSYCLETGSVLVSLENHVLDLRVRSLLVNGRKLGERVWTSGRSNNSNRWVWASSGRDFAYQNWNENLVATPASRKCVATGLQGYILASQYNWKPADCEEKLFFICQS